MTAPASIVRTALGPIEIAVSGSGPEVLILHGTMGGWTQGRAIARAIAPEGARILAVSRPGYGHTPLASGRGSTAQADLCAALLDSLGIDRVAVLGVSGGTPTALDLAQRHPDRVWGLVIVSGCAVRTVTPTLPLPVRLGAQLTRLPPVARWMRTMWTSDLDKAASFLVPEAELRARLLAHPENGPLFTDFLLGTVDHMYLRIRGTLNDIENMRVTDPALEEIAAPSLIVHGTTDHMLPYADHAPVFESRIPDAELLTIEGGGHAALFTHRDQVRTAVAAFLSARAPASGSRAAG